MKERATKCNSLRAKLRCKFQDYEYRVVCAGKEARKREESSGRNSRCESESSKKGSLHDGKPMLGQDIIVR